MPYKSSFWCTEKCLERMSLCVPSLQLVPHISDDWWRLCLAHLPLNFLVQPLLTALMGAFVSPSPSEESEITGFSWSAPWRVPNPAKPLSRCSCFRVKTGIFLALHPHNLWDSESTMISGLRK